MSESIPTQTPVSVPTSAPGKITPVPAGSVGTEQLANEAVTTAKIALSAITSALIANETIKAEDIENGAITEGKLAAGAVTAAKLGALAVGSAALAAGAVTAAKLGAEAVEAAAIKALAVTEPKIAAEAVSEAKLTKALTEKIVPGAWKTLEALNKVEDGKVALGTSAIGVRVEDGAMARLRGGLKCTAKIPTATHIFTLPVGTRPLASVFVVGKVAAQAFSMLIGSNGEVIIEVAAELAEGNLILLDGLTWSIT